MSNGPIFDQRGQNVIHQFNAAGNISFGAVDSKEELIRQLHALVSETKGSKQLLQLNDDQVLDVTYNIEKATTEAEKAEPRKTNMMNFLSQAQKAVLGITAATELSSTLATCIDKVDALFR